MSRGFWPQKKFLQNTTVMGKSGTVWGLVVVGVCLPFGSTLPCSEMKSRGTALLLRVLPPYLHRYQAEKDVDCGKALRL